MKQLGRNDKYPKEIETWKLDQKPIPLWLTDRCKVLKLDDYGDPVLDIRESESGYELITSGNNQILVKVQNKDDIICFGDNRIFVLTEKQLNLLYDK